MVSTRASSSKKTRPSGKSPLDGEAKQQRLLRQLHIDGTEALKGDDIKRKTSHVESFRGGRYEMAADGISWATTCRKRSSSQVDETSSPPAKKQRREAALSTTQRKSNRLAMPSKKRKLGESSLADDDDSFLVETVRDLKKAKLATKSSRQAELRMMLPYLDKLQRPSRVHTRQQANPGEGAPDAYELDSNEAKALLRSTAQVDAPVFISGVKIPIFDPDSDARPIEQIFDWLADEDEEFHTLDMESRLDGDRTPEKAVKVAEMRQRFVEEPQVNRPYPWNFPEIPLPTVTETMPDILKHPSCNMIKDIMKFVQRLEPEEVCPATCPHHGKTAENCPDHIFTATEIVQSQNCYAHWLGTIMMAEPGAFTQFHRDTFGFGTFICVGEGEIGFSWLANPTAAKSKQRWLYKVMRAGDAVYMEPNRYHLVFRRPNGGQTLAWAPRVLRYCDVEQWLKIILEEIEDAISGKDEHKYMYVWRGLAIGAKHLLRQAMEKQRFERFGGENVVISALEVIGDIENRMKELLGE